MAYKLAAVICHLTIHRIRIVSRQKDSIDMFKYNVAANPGSSTAYDSLAEGYNDIGEKELSIENFKKMTKHKSLAVPRCLMTACLPSRSGG